MPAGPSSLGTAGDQQIRGIRAVNCQYHVGSDAQHKCVEKCRCCAAGGSLVQLDGDLRAGVHDGGGLRRREAHRLQRRPPVDALLPLALQ